MRGEFAISRVSVYSRDYKAVLYDGLNWAYAPPTLDGDAKVQFIIQDGF